MQSLQVIMMMMVFQIRLMFMETMTQDELGDIPDIDDDNDGISDVAENVFVTYYQDFNISIGIGMFGGGGPGKNSAVTYPNHDLKQTVMLESGRFVKK